MPFTRVSLRAGKSAAYKEAIFTGIYESMRETFSVAEGDRFMVAQDFGASDFTYHPTYLGMRRTDDVVVIEITCNNTRTVDQKKALYQRITERLEKAPGISPDNVVICLIEVAKENWSMGGGKASFA